MSEHNVPRLREYSLAELAAQYGFSGRRIGKRIAGCCPLPGHRDKTASFSIRIFENDFKCFGCGCGGDVFDFIGHVERVSGFHQQAKRLEQVTGIPPLEDNRTPAQRAADQRAAVEAKTFARDVTDWAHERAIDSECRKAHLIDCLHWAWENDLEITAEYFERELASIPLSTLQPRETEHKTVVETDYRASVAADSKGAALRLKRGRANREHAELITAGIVQMLAIQQHMNAPSEGRPN